MMQYKKDFSEYQIIYKLAQQIVSNALELNQEQFILEQFQNKMLEIENLFDLEIEDFFQIFSESLSYSEITKTIHISNAAMINGRLIEDEQTFLKKVEEIKAAKDIANKLKYKQVFKIQQEITEEGQQINLNSMKVEYFESPNKMDSRIEEILIKCE